MTRAPRSPMVPEVEPGQCWGIGGLLACGCIVAVAAAVGVGIGLWLLADRILTMLGG